MADQYLQQLTEESTPVQTDYVPISDNSTQRLRKLNIRKLFVTTGLAGGQLVYGGTQSGDGLQIESTTNAVKGPIHLYSSQFICYSDSLQAIAAGNHNGEGIVSIGGSGLYNDGILTVAPSNSGSASVYLRGGSSEPSAPQNGSIWNNSNVGNIVNYIRGAKHYTGGAIWTSQSNVLTFNTVVETSMLSSSGKGTKTFPANFFTAGRVVEIRIAGYITTSGTPSLRIRGYLGGVARLDSTAVSMPSDLGTGNTREGQFQIIIHLICHSTGSSGQFRMSGIWILGNATNNQMTLNNLHANSSVSPTFTLNTSAAQTFDVTSEWGTAFNTNEIGSEIAMINVIS
jgi:hypothetical protein